MSIFAIGDTHLSFGTNKPMDIFKGWNDYVSRLEENWKAIIKEEDTVVIPGDTSWAMSLDDALFDFDFLDRLPGKKILIKGNHDYWWSTKTKMENFFDDKGFSSLKILHNNAYLVGDFSICGTRGWFFDDETPQSSKLVLREAGRLRESIKKGLALGGEPIVFLHYPPINDSQCCEEIYSVLVDYNIKRCYYGHIHGENASKYAKFLKDGISFSLISSDYLKFCPKLIEK